MGAVSGSGLSLGTLWINIAANLTEAEKALQKFGQDTSAAIDEQKKKWEGLKDIGQSMTQLGGTLTAALTLPIAGLGAAAVSAASEFESSLNKITAVSGTTGNELEQLRALAMKLGADTKFSAQEAAEGMGNLAAAGLSTDQIMASMAGTLDLAAAGELEVARAAEVTSDTLSQFGLDAGEAGRVADVFAQGAAASSISVEQMAQSMKYAGPIAQSAGASLEEMATATALLGNAGIKGEQAGTSLRGVISSLVSPSKSAAEALEDLGIRTEDSAGKMLPLDTIFAQLQQKGATTADMFKIFGENAASAASVLTKDAGPAWAAMTKEIDNSDGAAKRMAETLNTGMKGAWEQMKGSLDTVLIALGTALLPLLTTLIEKGTAFVNDWILPAVQAFGQLDPALQTIVIALGAALAAIGPIILAAGAFVSAFAAIAPIITVAGGAIAAFVGALSAPVLAIAAITAALIALGVWIYANWDSIVATLTNAWTGIQAAWTTVWTTITGAITAIWEGFKSAVEPAWKFIVDLVSAVWNVITAIWEAQWKLILAAVTAIWKAIEPYVRQVLDPVVEFVSDLWNDIKRLWNSAWSAIDKAVTSAWETIAKAAKTVFSPAVKFLGDVWDGLKQTWTRVWTGIEDTLTKLWERMAGAAKAAWEQIAKIGNIITGIPAKLNNLAGSIRRVSDEADRAAGHSPIPELAEALEDVNGASVPTPGLLDKIEIAIRDLGTASVAAHANLNFTPDFSAIQSGAASASGSINALDLAFDGLDLTAGAAHANLNFTTDFSAIQSGAVTAAGAIGSITGAAANLNTQGSADLRAFASSAGTAKTDVSTAMGDMAREVSTVITNFAQDISKSLWSGEGSWSEKGLNALKSLGQAVTSQFITPFATAIANFLSGALADLLGATGLGGVLDKIKDIGKTASEAIGSAAPTPGAPAPPGGIGGGGGGGAGAIAGGLTGWITAISSGISAITDVIGAFQMSETNKTLDRVVDHTLKTANDLANLRRDEWDRWGGWMQIKDDFLNRMNTLVDNSNLASHQLNDIIRGVWSVHDGIGQMLAYSERIAVAGERQITIILQGSDPAAVATKLAQQLRLQGAVS